MPPDLLTNIISCFPSAIKHSLQYRLFLYLFRECTPICTWRQV